MYETRSLTGSADALAAHLDSAILRGSTSASVEHQDELSIGDARMLLRTYERYSMTGSNRLTLSVSILAVGDRMEVALTTSGRRPSWRRGSPRSRTSRGAPREHR
ncbi:DUF6054 family protein [Demequina subtropica]|uniref:DUF6054 family protein n=1 Tax=Demequina subtropica TaxID=1638989 RepID=UPI0007861C51|nr:DUF6054 family protein [Demequina subtropica]